MQKWEYKILNATNVSVTEEMINNLGEQGWELVSHVTSAGSTYKLIFKRPK